MAQPGESVRQYIAGLFDGDGCVRIRADSNTTIIQITQSCDSGVPPEFKLLHACYNGISRDYDLKVPTRRRKWDFVIRTADHLRFINDIAPFSRIKRPQLELARSYILGEVDWTLKVERVRAANLCKRMKLKPEYQNVSIEPLTHADWPYIAGFFIAEGCVIINNEQNLLQFAQESNLTLLNELKALIGGGSVGTGTLTVGRKQDVLYTLSQMMPFIPESTQKYPQLVILHDFLKEFPNDSRGCGARSQYEIDRRSAAKHVLQQLKRT